jgi:hypothetical protein
MSSNKIRLCFTYSDGCVIKNPSHTNQPAEGDTSKQLLESTTLIYMIFTVRWLKVVTERENPAGVPETLLFFV